MFRSFSSPYFTITYSKFILKQFYITEINTDTSVAYLIKCAEYGDRWFELRLGQV